MFTQKTKKNTAKPKNLPPRKYQKTTKIAKPAKSRKVSSQKTHSRGLKLKRKASRPPAKLLITLSGIGLALVIGTFIITVADPFSFFQDTASVSINVVEEKEPPIPETSDTERINSDISASYPEDPEAKKSFILEYYKAVISQALNNGDLDYAASLLASEYGYFVFEDDLESALTALELVDPNQFAPADRDNILRLIEDIKSRL